MAFSQLILLTDEPDEGKGSESTTEASIATKSYLVAVPRISIAEPLDVVEDEPGQRDDHQHDKGDGHEDDRRPAHVLLQVPGPDGDGHVHRHIALQQ